MPLALFFVWCKCRESSVKFVVQSPHPSVAAYFLSNKTVTPPGGLSESLDWFDRRFEFPAREKIEIPFVHLVGYCLIRS